MEDPVTKPWPVQQTYSDSGLCVGGPLDGMTVEGAVGDVFAEGVRYRRLALPGTTRTVLVLAADDMSRDAVIAALVERYRK